MLQQEPQLRAPEDVAGRKPGSFARGTEAFRQSVAALKAAGGFSTGPGDSNGAARGAETVLDAVVWVCSSVARQRDSVVEPSPARQLGGYR
jgi:hypothetical protein